MRKKAYFIVVVLVLAMLIVSTVACVDRDSDGLIKISSPKNLAVNGSTLSWDAVENATKYFISVEGVEQEAETKETTYDLAKIISGYGNFNIKVKAYGDGKKYGSSDWSQVFVYNKGNALDTPVINIDGTVASWAAVNDCESYTIKVYNGDGELLDTVAKTQDTSYNFEGKKDSEGKDLYGDYDKYKITVVAHPSEDKPQFADSVAGEAFYIKSKTLDVPVFSSLTTLIRWSAVSDASSYTVRLTHDDGTYQEISTTGTSYQRSKFNFSKPGVYYFTIKANGDGEVFLDSQFNTIEDKDSYEFKVTKLESLESQDVSLSYASAEDGAVLTWKIDANSLANTFNLSLKSLLANGDSELESSMTSKTISNVVHFAVGDVYKVFALTEDGESATLVDGATMLVYDMDGYLNVQRDGKSYIVVDSSDNKVLYKDFAPSDSVDIVYDSTNDKYIKKSMSIKDSEGQLIKQDTEEDKEVYGVDGKQLYYFEMEDNLDITKTLEYAEDGSVAYHVFSIKLDSIFMKKVVSGEEDNQTVTYEYLINDDEYYGVLYNVAVSTGNTDSKFEFGADVVTAGQYLSYKVPTKNDAGAWYITNRGEYAYIAINNFFNPDNTDTYTLASTDANKGNIDFGGYEIVTISDLNGIINGQNMTVSNMVISNKRLSQSGVVAVDEVDGSINYAMFDNINKDAQINNIFYLGVSVKEIDLEAMFDDEEKSSTLKNIDIAVLAQNNYGSINRVVVQSDEINMPCANVAGMVINNYGNIAFSQVFANLAGRNVAGVAITNYAKGAFATINETGFYGSINASVGDYINEGITEIYGAGLVIENKADEGYIAFITKSEAIGNVNVAGKGLNGVYAGGLVAINSSSIASSYSGQFTLNNVYDQIVADGDNGYAGGFVAYNKQGGVISDAYATGKASASLYVGGFVGLNEGEISSAYATGNTTNAGINRGAFAGKNNSTIKNTASYSTDAWAKDEVGTLITSSDKLANIISILYPETTANMSMAEDNMYRNPIINKKIYTKQYTFEISPAQVIEVEGYVAGEEVFKSTVEDIYGDRSQKGNKVIVVLQSGAMTKFVLATVK